MTDFCFAVHHSTDPASDIWAYCGRPRRDHEAAGVTRDALGNAFPYKRAYHDFQAEYDPQCGCGRTHPLPTGMQPREGDLSK